VDSGHRGASSQPRFGGETVVRRKCGLVLLMHAPDALLSLNPTPEQAEHSSAATKNAPNLLRSEEFWLELRARVRGHSLSEERTRVDDARARLPGLLEEVTHFCVGRDDASMHSLASEVPRKRRPLSAHKSGTKRKSSSNKRGDKQQQEGGRAEGATHAEGHRGWAASLSQVRNPEHLLLLLLHCTRA